MSPKSCKRSHVKLIPQNISPTSKNNIAKINKKPFDEIYNALPQVKQHFLIERKIGSGTFSNVYLAKIKGNIEAKPFVLKHIFSTSHPKRIENEIKCLKDIGGKENVVEIKSCLRHKGEVVIIMPYMKKTNFYKLINEMDIDNVREYMKSLLIALQHVHSFNIIHRDVKPNNFLFNHNTNTGVLVDFGLAEKVKTIKQSVVETNLLKTKISPKLSCKSVGKPERNKPFIVGRRCASLGSPKAKRRCLVEIQPNNLQVNRNLTKQNKKTFSIKNDCGNWKKEQLSSHLPQKFQFLSPNIKPIKQLTQRKNTVGDLIPSIKKNCAKKKQCSIVLDNDCNCFGKMLVCRKCLARPSANASRAGTSGFRPPEVLLRKNEQTTAVDIWAAGVIFISLLSGKCPFIQPADDMASLAQLMLIFGSKKIEEVAKICGKCISSSSDFKECNLKSLIIKLRSEKQTTSSSIKNPHGLRSPPKNQHNKSFSTNQLNESEAMETNSDFAGFSASEIPQCAYDLLFGLLDPNPVSRLTAKQALQNSFFKI